MIGVQRVNDSLRALFSEFWFYEDVFDFRKMTVTLQGYSHFSNRMLTTSYGVLGMYLLL